MTALRALLRGALGPEDWHTLVGNDARGLAYRCMAVASTLSTRGVRIQWSAETHRKIYTRILRLRSISQRQCNLLMEGREVRAPVRPIGFEAPPPWWIRGSSNMGMASRDGDKISPRPFLTFAKTRRTVTAPKERAEGRELRLYCPWVSCVEVASNMVYALPLDKTMCRKVQVYGRGCAARFALTAALCAQ